MITKIKKWLEAKGIVFEGKTIVVSELEADIKESLVKEFGETVDVDGTTYKMENIEFAPVEKTEKELVVKELDTKEVQKLSVKTKTQVIKPVTEEDEEINMTGKTLKSKKSYEDLSDIITSQKTVGTVVNVATAQELSDTISKNMHITQLLRFRTTSAYTMTVQSKTGRGNALFVASATDPANTEPAFSSYTVAMKKIMGLADLANEDIESATFGIVDDVATDMSYDIADRLDYALVAGDGTDDATNGAITGLNKYLRTAIAASKLCYHEITGSTWADITLADIQKVFAQLNSVGRRNTYAICSSKFFYWVIKPLAQAKAGSIQEFADGLVSAKVDGVPYIFSDNMPTATTAVNGENSEVPLIIGNIGASVGAIKGAEISVSTDSSEKFSTDVTVVKSRARYGITIDPSAAGSTTVSGSLAALFLNAS